MNYAKDSSELQKFGNIMYQHKRNFSLSVKIFYLLFFILIAYFI